MEARHEVHFTYLDVPTGMIVDGFVPRSEMKPSFADLCLAKQYGIEKARNSSRPVELIIVEMSTGKRKVKIVADGSGKFTLKPLF